MYVYFTKTKQGYLASKRKQIDIFFQQKQEENHIYKDEYETRTRITINPLTIR